MTVKHLQIFSLWAATLLSGLIFVFSGNTLFGDIPIRVILGFSAICIILFTWVSTVFLTKGFKVSFFNLFRVLGFLTALLNLVVVLYAAFTMAGYWSDEVNGIFYVFSGVSFVFVLFNYLALGNHSIQNQKQVQKPVVTDWIFTLFLPVLIAAYGIVSLYNQETALSSAGDPDFTIQPAPLMDLFEKDAVSANQQYIGKVIRFSGSVSEIGGDSSILVTLNAWKEGYTINCDFDMELKDKLSAVLQGDSLLLQCSCSGLSTPEEGMSLLSGATLEMTRCALITNFKNNPNLGTDVEHPKETPKRK
jgi:hypothetical protein